MTVRDKAEHSREERGSGNRSVSRMSKGKLEELSVKKTELEKSPNQA